MSSVRSTGASPDGLAAVAGAIGAQRLAIGEGVFAVGIALAIAAARAVDVAAVKHLGDARRAERLAGLNRRGVAAHGQRKILAVAAAHAKGRSGACDARRRRRMGWLIEAERIGEEIGLRRGLPRCCFWTPPNRKSNRPSAETLPGASASEPASVAAATSIMRRRMRGKANSVRNANSTPRNQRAEARQASVRVNLNAGW